LASYVTLPNRARNKSLSTSGSRDNDASGRTAHVRSQQKDDVLRLRIKIAELLVAAMLGKECGRLRRDREPQNGPDNLPAARSARVI
jgi:hypothetical protein